MKKKTQSNKEARIKREVVSSSASSARLLNALFLFFFFSFFLIKNQWERDKTRSAKFTGESFSHFRA
jgi:hypothetical protein